MKFPFRYLDTITKFLWTEYFGMFVQIRLIRPNFSGGENRRNISISIKKIKKEFGSNQWRNYHGRVRDRIFLGQLLQFELRGNN